MSSKFPSPRINVSSTLYQLTVGALLLLFLLFVSTLTSSSLFFVQPAGGAYLAFHRRDLAARTVDGAVVTYGMRYKRKRLVTNDNGGGGGDREKLILPKRDNNEAEATFTVTETWLDDRLWETHSVTTEDGYVLTLHRLPGATNSTPVYMQHGLLESSTDWLVAGRRKSFPYVLADNGYDVWLGNARGNTYSKRHVKLSPTDRRFWDFSWHELGIYDLPAAISYIWSLKGSSVFYVGHSMGATTFSVMSAERPEIADKVKAAFFLAPATYVDHMRAPIKLIAPFWSKIQRFANAIGMHELLPRGPFFDAFAKYICGSFMFRAVLCGNALFVIAGFNPEQLDYLLLQKIWSGFPAGTSMKLFVHWLQQIADDDGFRNFDYGYEGNVKIYNADEPPSYDLSKIRVPIAVFWSGNDLLVGEKDVYHFYNQIPLKLGIYKINHTKFNHFDFLWGVNAPELVYATVIDLMNGFNNQIVRK